MFSNASVSPPTNPAKLGPRRHLPNPLWAICTSATRAYASQALAVAGVPVPDVFVAAEDVKQGKPFPDPYLLGAEKCGVDPKNCEPLRGYPDSSMLTSRAGVVFEDAPSGIRSGNAAGCKTIALLTTHSREQVDAAQPDYVIQNMTQYVKRPPLHAHINLYLEYLFDACQKASKSGSKLEDVTTLNRVHVEEHTNVEESYIDPQE